MQQFRFVLVALPLAAVICSPLAANERTMRILSGASAERFSDFATRLLAEALGPILGARVVVENRTGMNGIVAA